MANYEMQLVAIPATKDSNIVLTTITADSKGRPAKPEQLLGILKQQLETGVAVFLYRKKDGSIRKAVGTASKDIIPVSKLTGKDAKEFATKVNYFDIEVQQFRSFEVSSLLAILVL